VIKELQSVLRSELATLEDSYAAVGIVGEGKVYPLGALIVPQSSLNS